MQPVRLQCKRTKGFRLISPNGLPIVCVTRPGKWGNPFPTAEQFRDVLSAVSQEIEANPLKFYFAETNRHMAEIARSIEELRGKNLACFCPPGKSCHADVLLIAANKAQFVPDEV